MKEKEPVEILFSGEPVVFGGLSNEEVLAKECPEKFKDSNPWSNYASSVFFRGANISNWKWVTEDQYTRKKQLACFHGLLSGFNLHHEDKEAVAGWMLSKMLKEVPKYLAPKK
jgi:hypothetical protein